MAPCQNVGHITGDKFSNLLDGGIEGFSDGHISLSVLLLHAGSALKILVDVNSLVS